MQNGQNMTAAVISEWIKTSVIPSFTIVSVKYFKQIPGLMAHISIVCSVRHYLIAVKHSY